MKKECSGKLRRILRSQKIRCTFYTESTLRKLLGKLKDRVNIEDKKTSFMKLTAVTAKECTSFNLNDL